MMVRVDNILTVHESVIEAIDALINLFSSNNDFKNKTEVQDLNKHLIELRGRFEGGTKIDFGKYGQLPS